MLASLYAVHHCMPCITVWCASQYGVHHNLLIFDNTHPLIASLSTTPILLLHVIGALPNFYSFILKYKPRFYRKERRSYGQEKMGSIKNDKKIFQCFLVIKLSGPVGYWLYNDNKLSQVPALKPPSVQSLCTNKFFLPCLCTFCFFFAFSSFFFHNFFV